MAVIVGARATATAVSGKPGVIASTMLGEVADEVLVFGYPGVVRTPTVAPTDTPDAVSAQVLDFSGAFIANLPDAQGLRWIDEHNTAGAGSIDYRRYDDVEALHANLWTAGNQILIRVGTVKVFRLILDSDGGYRINDTGDRIDTWPGTGALGVLNSGMCAPEYGFGRPEGTDARTFDYGSNPATGGWYVASEWHKPIGRLLTKSWRWYFKKRHLPKGYRDKKAQWLWWRDPDAKNSANETAYFSDSFTLSRARRVKIWAAGDDTLELQLDGEVQLTNGPGDWRRASTVVINLSAGTHWVAAKVSNTPGSVGNQNRSGFICSIARMDGDGGVAAWLLRTNPNTWRIRRQRTSPPGWFAAQILRQLVLEQQARACAGHSGVTLSFGTKTDSHGAAWVGRQELTITVGTQALDYIQQLVETGIDVAMSPDLVLSAWRTRGADRSGWVRLDQGTAAAMEESAAQLPPFKNVAYAKAVTGWAGRTDSASVSSHGRRETMISLGSARSPQHTAAQIAAMLPDLADPRQTIEVKISGADGGPQPYVDFFPADWVSYKAAGHVTWGRYRVMSISGEVAPEGHADWTIQLYED